MQPITIPIALAVPISPTCAAVTLKVSIIYGDNLLMISLPLAFIANRTYKKNIACHEIAGVLPFLFITNSS